MPEGVDGSAQVVEVDAGCEAVVEESEGKGGSAGERFDVLDVGEPVFLRTCFTKVRSLRLLPG